ncbi:MAG: HAD family hydrolase [Rhodospirillaceae bacterium]|nr:HAD family hydrolase [Rhodospirillaceae bacterium]
MTTAFDLVLFDCDGVLVDSEAISARCVAEALRQAGYDIDEAGVHARFMGISNPTMCAIIEGEMGRPLPAGFLEALRARLISAAEDELRPVEGVREVVDHLAIPCCVASSSNPDRVRRYLELTHLDHRLGRHIFSATMVAQGKPAPDLFLHAAKAMGARPDRSVVIEDSIAGVRAGKAAGMTVFGFTGAGHVDGAVHGPRLLAAGADLVFDAMAALPDLLARPLPAHGHPPQNPPESR